MFSNAVSMYSLDSECDYWILRYKWRERERERERPTQDFELCAGHDWAIHVAGFTTVHAVVDVFL